MHPAARRRVRGGGRAPVARSVPQGGSIRRAAQGAAWPPAEPLRADSGDWTAGVGEGGESPKDGNTGEQVSEEANDRGASRSGTGWQGCCADSDEARQHGKRARLHADARSP